MAKDQYKYFRIEARELLDGMGRAVLELERGANGDSSGSDGTAELVARILRMAHTLKRASRIVKQPGMDGFEFVSRTREDARLSKTPAILVTSRNAPEDRRRGEQAGASAYIVKGEFDQSYLLRMTRELVGWT